MKKLLSVFMVLSFLGMSCSELPLEEEGISSELTSLEASLNLTSPSGERLASDINALKAKGGVSNVEVISIEYLNVDKGYVAVVNCLDINNHVSNFALIKGNKYINELGLRTRLLTKSESGGEGEAVAKCDRDATKCNECVVIMNPNFSPNIYCSCKSSVNGQKGGCTLK